MERHDDDGAERCQQLQSIMIDFNVYGTPYMMEQSTFLERFWITAEEVGGLRRVQVLARDVARELGATLVGVELFPEVDAAELLVFVASDQAR